MPYTYILPVVIDESTPRRGYDQFFHHAKSAADALGGRLHLSCHALPRLDESFRPQTAITASFADAAALRAFLESAAYRAACDAMPTHIPQRAYILH